MNILMLPRNILKKTSVSIAGEFNRGSISKSVGDYQSSSRVSTDYIRTRDHSSSNYKNESTSTRNFSSLWSTMLNVVRLAYPNTIKGSLFSEFAMEQSRDSVYISPIYTPRSAPTKKRGKKK